MSVPALLAFGLLSASVSGVLTWLLIAHFTRSKQLDVPNDRSLHTTPVPRGGGLAIVATLLGAIAYLVVDKAIPVEMASCIAMGTFVVALVGWMDDKWGLSASLRLLVHLFASALVALCIPAFLNPPDNVVARTADMIPAPVYILCLAWFINLYNFMDGMDGLAASQAVIFGAFGAFFLLVGGHIGWAACLVALAGAGIGFLLWNRPKAKVFMGDAGSGALGFAIGVFVLITFRMQPAAGPSLLILVAVFLIDATYTLIRRFQRGAKVQEAHRSHAYQKAVLTGRTHAQVLGAIVLFQLLWLVPLAGLAYTQPELAWLAAALAGVPILIAAVKLKAGTEETAP